MRKTLLIVLHRSVDIEDWDSSPVHPHRDFRIKVHVLPQTSFVRDGLEGAQRVNPEATQGVLDL